MRLVRGSVQLVSAGVIALTFLSYLCPFINPELFSWLTFFGTAFPWLLLCNVALLLVWTWKMHRFALYHLGIIVLGWHHVTAFVGLNVGRQTEPEQGIVVMTHNLGHLFAGQKRLSEDDIRQKAVEYAKFLNKKGAPDILCTQETRGLFYKALAEQMKYPYSFNLKKGTVILSKYPLPAGGDIPFGKTNNSTLWADAKLPDGHTIRIYNVHLQSNKVTSATEKVIDSDFKEEQTWHEIGSVLEKVGGATAVRSEQAAMLREHLGKSPHPVVVCGDFNDTPNSWVYDEIAGGLTDTFREKGFGRGTTFAGVLPMLRIDYILHDPDLNTWSCNVIRENSFSDHYSVRACIGW